MNTPAASSEESQVLVPSEGGHLAGMLHTPKKSVRSPAVLFCPPFGDERKAAWRAMAQLARTLAGDGWPVLRFDYRGCGESPGGFVDATLETRLADIQTAASFLQTEVGSPGICCLGLRFGATLALRAFEMLPDCQDVIFIEPVIDGGEYFDRMEQRKKLR